MKIAKNIERQRRAFYKPAIIAIRKALAVDRIALGNDFKHARSTQELINMSERTIKKEGIENALTTVYKNTGKFFAEQTFDSFGKAKAFNRSSPLTEDYWFAYMDRFVKQKLGNRIKWITGTTEETFKSTAQRLCDVGIKEGLGIPDIAKNIMSQLQITEKYRAERIARTEVVSASNEASKAGAEATGLELDKEWITYIDDKTRDSHIDMNGETTGMDEPFSNGLDVPGDVNGASEDVINCRCTLGYNAAKGAEYAWGREL